MVLGLLNVRRTLSPLQMSPAVGSHVLLERGIPIGLNLKVAGTCIFSIISGVHIASSTKQYNHCH